MYRISNDHTDAAGKEPFLRGDRSSYPMPEKENREVGVITKNVLIIDDDVSFRDVLCDYLCDGNEFKIAARCGSYMEAKAFCSRESNMKAVDAIILDVMLPYKQGYAPETKMGLVILEKLREQLNFQGPVIVLTNSLDSEDGREALEKGCNGYLCKHANVESIPRMVNELKLALSGDVVLVSSKLRHLMVEKKEVEEPADTQMLSALGDDQAWTKIRKELGFEGMRQDQSGHHAIRRTSELSPRSSYTGLGASATMVRHVINNAPRPIFITTTDGVIEFANEEAERLFNFDQIQFLGQRIQDIFPTVNLTALVRGTEFECYVRGAGGVQFPVSVATNSFEEGDEPHLIHIFTDLTTQKSTEQRLKLMLSELEKSSNRLEELAKSDPLTGLLNRRGLETILERELALARRNQSEVIAVLVDLDSFKGINDVYGHAGGDMVLKNVAKAMKDTVRTSDWVGRIGGDEFMIFLPSTSLENGVMCAERIREAVVASPVSKDGGLIKATISLGVARLPQEVSTLEQVLELTKSGLKSSKKAGKNTVSVSKDHAHELTQKSMIALATPMRFFTRLTKAFKSWCTKAGISK